MKRTVLDMVQEMLSRSDGDSVNSITDTEEAMQMAMALKSTFEEMIAPGNLTEHEKLTEFNASGDNTKPTLMYLPDKLAKIHWVKYDIRTEGTVPDYYDMIQWDVDTFFNKNYQIDKTQSAFFQYQINIDGDTIDIFGYNDSPPMHYTVLADKYIIFDSYDSSVDTTLQKSKTLVYAAITPSFTLTDNYIPELRPDQFALLVNEALKQTSIENRQAENPIANQRARRGWIRKTRINDDLKFRNYGRK